MRKIGIVSLLVALGAGCLLAQSPADPSAVITADMIKNYIKTISADAFEGRGPGTAGAAKARDYIIQELKSAGAVAGPGGWIQKVPLRRTGIMGAGRCALPPPVPASPVSVRGCGTSGSRSRTTATSACRPRRLAIRAVRTRATSSRWPV